MFVKTPCDGEDNEKVVWKVALMWPKDENHRSRKQQ